MMKWFDELRITKRPLKQIGLLMVVREVMHNHCRMSLTDADDLFGAGWKAEVEELRKAGMMKIEWFPNSIAMKVFVRGDIRRVKSRLYARKHREKLLKGCK